MESVELRPRMQPDSNHISDSVNDAITTLRVLVDRGIVAKSQGRLSTRPTTVHIVQRQSVRYTNGSVQPDGSFRSEVHILDKTTSVRGLNGDEKLLPEKLPLKGLRTISIVEKDGKLREGSIQVTGPDAKVVAQIRPTIISAISQAASIPPIVLKRGKSVAQTTTMQIPVPGIPNFDLKMNVLHQLLGVEHGVARIQTIHNMDFAVPTGVNTMQAEGSGGGTMRYDVNTQTVLSDESGTLMKFIVDASDGVIEVAMNSRHVQTTRATSPAPL